MESSIYLSEGNCVIDPDGETVDVSRVFASLPRGDEKAAIVHYSANGQPTFDPERDFVDFPGGGKKFTIRFDPQTKRAIGR